MSVTSSAGKGSAVNTQHWCLLASDSQVIYLSIHQVLNEEEAKANLLALISMVGLLDDTCTMSMNRLCVCARVCVYVCLLFPK